MANFAYQGTWTDIAASPSGLARVRVLDFDTLVVDVDLVEVWRHDVGTTLGVSVDLRWVRCAVNSSTGEIRAIATYENSSGQDIAIVIHQASVTTIGQVYGQRPVLLTFESGSWIQYYCTSPFFYARHPMGGSATAVANPFSSGTALGMLDVVATVPVWAESTTAQGTYYSVTLGGAVFQFPMTRTVTVGQAVGAPITAEAIIGWTGSALSTVIPIQGFEPHVAAITAGTYSGKYAICARTLTVQNQLGQDCNAALVVAPPWPAYSGTTSGAGRSRLQGLYRQPIDRDGDLVTDEWYAFFTDVERNASSAIDLGSTDVTGVLSGSQGGTGGSTGLDQLDANSLVTGTIPQARKWLELVITTTGTENNYAVGPYDQITCNNATPLTFTGFTAGVGAQRLVILPTGTSTVTLVNQSGSSTAANRIVTGTGGNLTLSSPALLAYETEDDRWTLIAGGSGGGAVWGQITGVLSDQLDLQAALDAKQDLLIWDEAIGSYLIARNP